MPSETVTPEEKRCSRCHEHRPLADFYRDKRAKDGLGTTCKPCAKEKARLWEEANPDRAAELSRRRYEQNRERAKARAKKTRQEKPEQARKAKNRWRKRNPDLVARYGRIGYDRHPETRRANRARAAQRHPEKEAARAAVAEALRTGQLIRPELCEDCGSVGRPTRDSRSPIQGHHPDYSKPLEVEWLCRACHQARHPRASE